MAATSDSSRPAPQKSTIVLRSSRSMFAPDAVESALSKLAICVSSKRREIPVADLGARQCEMGLSPAAISIRTRFPPARLWSRARHFF